MPSRDDPGGPTRAEANALLDRARERVESAGRKATSRIREAAESAPGFLTEAWHHTTEFFKGAGEAVFDLADLVFRVSPTYALVGPAGWAYTLTGLTNGVVYG